MLRILRLSSANALIWQLSLIGNSPHILETGFLLLPLFPSYLVAISPLLAMLCSQSKRMCYDNADRELDEALWQSGSRQLLATQREPKSSASTAASSTAVKRRALEQVCNGCLRTWGLTL